MSARVQRVNAEGTISFLKRDEALFAEQEWSWIGLATDAYQFETYEKADVKAREFEDETIYAVQL